MIWDCHLPYQKFKWDGVGLCHNSLDKGLQELDWSVKVYTSLIYESEINQVHRDIETSTHLHTHMHAQTNKPTNPHI